MCLQWCSRCFGLLRWRRKWVQRQTLDFSIDLLSYPHLWSWHESHGRKDTIADKTPTPVRGSRTESRGSSLDLNYCSSTWREAVEVFRASVTEPPGCLPEEVFRVSWRARGRARTMWRNYIFLVPPSDGGGVWGEGSLALSAQTAASVIKPTMVLRRRPQREMSQWHELTGQVLF